MSITEKAEPQDRGGKPANIAPDAVKDPNEKTEGAPGKGPNGGKTQNDETDPGGS